MNCKNNSFMTKKKAFTFVELLVVIAIIGILFVVLVSRVNFATDKAKATGVQTDFRSFQIACEQVAKDNDGFLTFGWDTGDVNGDRIRNAYDEGDNGIGGGIAKNGVQDGTEVFTGHKVYDETWTGIYTLTNPADANDNSGILALESAINKNLDASMQIKINADYTITTQNDLRDAWGNPYQGELITNKKDNGDRGAIVFYSKGPDGVLATTSSIKDGNVTLKTNSNANSKDDMTTVISYSVKNGGTVHVNTNGVVDSEINGPELNVDNTVPNGEILPGLYETNSNYENMLMSWDDILEQKILVLNDSGQLWNGKSYYNEPCKGTELLAGDLVLPNDGSIKSLSVSTYKAAFGYCEQLTSVKLPDGLTEIPQGSFYRCKSLRFVNIPDTVTKIGLDAFQDCKNLNTITIPQNVTEIGTHAFFGNEKLAEVINLSSLDIKTDNSISYGYLAYYCSYVCNRVEDSRVTIDEDGYVWYEDPDRPILINDYNVEQHVILPTNYKGKSYDIGPFTWYQQKNLVSMVIPEGVEHISYSVWSGCTNLRSIKFPTTLKTMASSPFEGCSNLEEAIFYDGLELFTDNLYSYSPKVTQIYIPNTVKKLQGNSLSKTSIESIIIPDSVEFMGSGVFKDSKVKDVFFEGNSFEAPDQIGNSYQIFAGCELNSVIIGATTTQFKTHILSTAKSIKTLTLHAFEPPKANGTIKLNGITAIYVPEDSVELYKNAKYWSAFADIIQPIQ